MIEHLVCQFKIDKICSYITSIVLILKTALTITLTSDRFLFLKTTIYFVKMSAKNFNLQKEFDVL